ncbi:DUF4870 family protein [Fluviispira multicolorata]|uniref:Transmembrane protein n=1 Tax=Fluviispira multicolorata TaxID=2654512 RepID=A0A833JCN2_9BACT|nr:hypothetical protein [Fluviispira multicolorata]KAB8030657.1 hypothetical protein GCL57_06695 [Fluviispira multicolorata]
MQHNEYLRTNSTDRNLPVTNSNQNIISVVYILQFLSLFTAGTFLILPLIINYIFRHKSRETWLDSHFRWQIQTFWFAALFYGIAYIFGFIPFIGWLFSFPSFLIASLIILIRSYKGWKKLSKQLPPSSEI